MDIIGAVNPDATQRIVVASALLMAAVVVLFLAVRYYRRYFLLDDEASGPRIWTLQELSEMRDRGELTGEEYEALRATLIASFHGSSDSRPPSDSDNKAVHGHVYNFDLEKGQRG